MYEKQLSLFLCCEDDSDIGQCECGVGLCDPCGYVFYPGRAKYLPWYGALPVLEPGDDDDDNDDNGDYDDDNDDDPRCSPLLREKVFSLSPKEMRVRGADFSNPLFLDCPLILFDLV